MQLCVPTVLNISRYCILNKQDRCTGKSLFIAETTCRNKCMLSWSLQFTSLSGLPCCLVANRVTGEWSQTAVLSTWMLSLFSCGEHPQVSFIFQIAVAGLWRIIHLLLRWHCYFLVLWMASLFLNPVNNINPMWASCLLQLFLLHCAEGWTICTFTRPLFFSRIIQTVAPYNCAQTFSLHSVGTLLIHSY